MQFVDQAGGQKLAERGCAPVPTSLAPAAWVACSARSEERHVWRNWRDYLAEFAPGFVPVRCRVKRGTPGESPATAQQGPPHKRLLQ